MFLNNNKDQFTAKSQIYHYVTRQQSDFHQPIANRAKYQKGIGYMGVKVFNRLPINIKKEFDNSKKFRHGLKNFLTENHFIHYKIILNCKIYKLYKTNKVNP